MEWDNTAADHLSQQRHHEGCSNGDPILNFPTTNNSSSSNINAAAGNMLYVKVMTDDQLETLRKQIAVYATICEQLVDMHKTLSAHQDLAAGGRLGSLYCDPLMGGMMGGHKMSARQRWTPTPIQLQILERIFEQGNGTPTKQKIKEITTQLSQHGQISETNVYNWFQNRRARSKRKQLPTTTNNTTTTNNGGAGSGGDVSEVETEVDSLQIEHHHHHHHQDMIMNCNNSKSEEMMYCSGTTAAAAEDHCFSHVDQLHYLSQSSQPSATGGYSLYDQAAAEDYGLPG